MHRAPRAHRTNCQRHDDARQHASQTGRHRQSRQSRQTGRQRHADAVDRQRQAETGSMWWASGGGGGPHGPSDSSSGLRTGLSDGWNSRRLSATNCTLACTTCAAGAHSRGGVSSASQNQQSKHGWAVWAHCGAAAQWGCGAVGLRCSGPPGWVGPSGCAQSRGWSGRRRPGPGRSRCSGSARARRGSGPSRRRWRARCSCPATARCRRSR